MNEIRTEHLYQDGTRASELKPGWRGNVQTRFHEADHVFRDYSTHLSTSGLASDGAKKAALYRLNTQKCRVRKEKVWKQSMSGRFAVNMQNTAPASQPETGGQGKREEHSED